MNASAIPGRNTVAEVYAQIVKDLTEAIDSKALNVSKSAGDNQGFIDEWAAKALLTRVYIYMGKNQEALDIAKTLSKILLIAYGQRLNMQTLGIKTTPIISMK